MYHWQNEFGVSDKASDFGENLTLSNSSSVLSEKLTDKEIDIKIGSVRNEICSHEMLRGICKLMCLALG